MKKFTIITKDGSKCLSRTAPHGVDPIQWHSDNHDLPYIGSRPEGTTLDESEVREIKQMQYEGKWIPAEEDLIDFATLTTRTAYTDAESHDTSNDNPRYPLFSHMSSEHGLTLLDSELDEIARHAAPMTGVDYWKRRCEAAEKYIEQTPCDHDITPKQIEAHEAWQEIIEEGRAYGN